MKRFLMAMFAVLLLVQGFAYSAPITLHFYQWSGAQTTLAKEIADKWMKLHPDVQIKVDEFDYLPFLDTINNMVLSGEGGDIMMTLGGSWHVPFLVDNDGLLNLDKYYAKYKWESVLNEANKITKYKGHYYYITSMIHVAPVVYYNVDLFKKYNLKFPKNEEELYAVVKTLKANGYEGVGLGTLDPNYADIFMSGMLPRFMSVSEYNTMITTAGLPNYKGLKFTDPKVVKAYKTFKKWIDDGIFISGMTGTDDGQARSLFLKQSCAMLVGASWTTTMFQDSPPSFAWDVGLIPQLQADIPVSCPFVTNNGLTAKADTKYPDQVAAFMDFYMNKENQILALKNMGNIPIRIDISMKEMQPFLTPAKARLIEFVGEYNKKKLTTEMMLTTLAKKIVDPYLEKLTDMENGKITPEELMAATEKIALEVRSGKR
jgi:ABC-type glycerol-3-phosphate transport system substrate-binding protein